jgi:hypothetical protein
LLEQDEHADVSFEFPDGTNVRAHRLILSVRSPVVLTKHVARWGEEKKLKNFQDSLAKNCKFSPSGKKCRFLFKRSKK